MKSYVITMLLLSWSSIFVLVPWGFIAFGSSSMIMWDGYNVSQLGLLLTGIACAMIFGVFIMGFVGDKAPPKTLILFSMILLLGGSFSVIFIDAYWGLMLGFVLYGLAISIWKIVPYNQLSVAVPESEYPIYYGIFECCFSMLSPAGARFMMMVSTVTIDSKWGWRMPWIIILFVTAANTVLIFLFASFERPQSFGKANLSEHSYAEKATELLHSKVGIILLFAVGMAGFGFSSLALWSPYIAVERFATSFSTVQVTMAIASTFAYPMSVGGSALLVYTTAGRVESGLKYSIFFLVFAAAAALLLPMQSSFTAFAPLVIAYLALGFFPYAYYKVIPEMLELPEDVTLFILSYYNLSYIFFGDILASVVTTQMMYRVGISASLWLVAFVVTGAAVLWGICSMWAWLDTGPVKQLVELRKARTKQNAAGAWRRLRMRVAVTKAAKAKKPADPAVEDYEAVENKFKSVLRTARLTAACAAFSYGVPLHMLGEKKGAEDDQRGEDL